MIASFQHKGLEALYRTGAKKGVRQDQVKRLARILTALENAIEPKDLDLPGYKLHRLSGARKGTWSVWVSGNWRVTFTFAENGNVAEVNLEDYH